MVGDHAVATVLCITLAWILKMEIKNEKNESLVAFMIWPLSILNDGSDKNIDEIWDFFVCLFLLIRFGCQRDEYCEVYDVVLISEFSC